MTVLIFVSTDCPISNRYAPEIKRLHDEFASRGVRFRLVYPNPLDNDAAISKHLEEYGYPQIARARSRSHAGEEGGRHHHARSRGVRCTRSGSSIAAASTTASSSSAASVRPPTQRDLRNALTALLAGRRVSPSHTQAVGCFIADMK